jgi:hypothetical protein
VHRQFRVMTVPGISAAEKWADKSPGLVLLLPFEFYGLAREFASRIGYCFRLNELGTLPAVTVLLDSPSD